MAASCFKFLGKNLGRCATIGGRRRSLNILLPRPMVSTFLLGAVSYTDEQLRVSNLIIASQERVRPRDEKPSSGGIEGYVQRRHCVSTQDLNASDAQQDACFEIELLRVSHRVLIAIGCAVNKSATSAILTETKLRTYFVLRPSVHMCHLQNRPKRAWCKFEHACVAAVAACSLQTPCNAATAGLAKSRSTFLASRPRSGRPTSGPE